MSENVAVLLIALGLLLMLAIPFIASHLERRRAQSITEHRMTRVDELREGDCVDLEGDPFSDPDGDDPRFETEYAVVEAVEFETENCIVIHYGNHACGYPPNHRVPVKM